MKKMLVLVDGSTPSANAADYAAGLARETGFDEVVLMANLFVPLFEQVVPSPDMIQVGAADIQDRMAHEQAHLRELKTAIGQKLPSPVTVRSVIGDKPLLRAVLEVVEEEAPSLVVIGSGNRILGEDCSIARHLIALARVIPVPVLVVPPEAHFRPIVEALVEAATDITAGIKDAFTGLFGPVSLIRRPLDKKDVLKGVLRDAAGTRVQLIIALPRKHSFFYQLTHQNIMHGVVMNSTLPILIWK